MKQQLASGQGYTPYDTNHAPHTERTCPLVGSIGSCLKRSIFEDEFAQVRDRQLCIGNSLLALTAVLALAVVRHGKANLLVEISDNRQTIAADAFQLPTFPNKFQIKRLSEVDQLYMADSDQHGTP